MTAQQLLGMDDDQYEMTVLSNYMAWCKNHNGGQDAIMQRFLSSPYLFNWWYQEYQKLEQNFLAIAKPYLNYMNKQELVELYRKEILQMYNLFSKPLIYTAKYKKQEITNPIHN